MPVTMYKCNPANIACKGSAIFKLGNKLLTLQCFSI